MKSKGLVSSHVESVQTVKNESVSSAKLEKVINTLLTSLLSGGDHASLEMTRTNDSINLTSVVGTRSLSITIRNTKGRRTLS